MAPEAEEGRDKLRKALGSGKYALIRRYPNGETQYGEAILSCIEHIDTRREPAELKHLSRQRKRNQPRFRE